MDNLFAINYIIPTKDKVFFAACKKGDVNVCLGSYDKLTGEIKYWRDDKDTNIENMCVNQKTGKIYVSVYSEKEDRYNLQHQGNDNFVIATHSVWELDFDLENEKKLFSLPNRWIRMILINDSKLLSIYDKKYNDSSTPSENLYLNLDTNIKENFTLPDYRIQKGDGAFSRDGENMYILTMLADDKERYLYKYNIAEKSFELLFKVDDEFINNIQLIRGMEN